VPTYQYACTDCGDRSEVVQRFTDDSLTLCTACGGKLRKVFSPVGIVFKGSGFYRTDSRNGSSPVGAGKDGAGAAKDGAGAAKDGAGAAKDGAASRSSSADSAASGSSSNSAKNSAGSTESSGGKTATSSGGAKKSSSVGATAGS